MEAPFGSTTPPSTENATSEPSQSTPELPGCFQSRPGRRELGNHWTSLPTTADALRRIGFLLLVGLFAALGIGGVAYSTLNSVIQNKDTLAFDHSQRLVDASALRLAAEQKVAHSRGYLLSGNPELRARTEQARQDFLERLSQMEAGSLRHDEKAQLTEIRRLEEAHQKSLEAIFAMKSAKIPAAAVGAAFEQQVRPRRLALEGALDKFTRSEESFLQAAREESRRHSLTARGILIGATAISLFLLMGVSFIVYLSLRKISVAETAARNSLAAETEAVRRFLELVNHLDHSFVWEADAEPFKFTFMSERIQFLLGVSPSDVVNETEIFFSYIHPDDRARLKETIETVKRTRVDGRCEHRMRTTDGKQIWVQTGLHVRRVGGQRDRIFGLSVDISLLKAAQERTHQLEQRMNLSLKGADIGHWEIDLATGILSGSEIEARLLGFTPGFRVTQEQFYSIIHEEDVALVRNAIERAAQSTEEVRSEFRIRHPNGEIRWMLGAGRVVYDQNYPQGRILGITMDIHERKLAESQANAAIKRLTEFKQALDAAAIVATTDVKGTITYVNDRFCEISKYSREELIGQNHRILNAGYHSKEFFREMWQTIAAGKIWRGDIKNRAKDGSYYWVQTAIVPFLDDRGKPFQYLAIRTDITEKRRIQEELIAAKEMAESADRAKSQFLANMSHEIRTPMNAILGFTELLDSATSDDQRREYISRIRNNGEHLLTVIDDILNLSRFEDNRVPVERLNFAVMDLVNDIVETFRPLANKKGIALDLKFLSSIPQVVCTDPARVRQILMNLIGNAIKFTSKGSVILRIGVRSELKAEAKPGSGSESRGQGRGELRLTKSDDRREDDADTVDPCIQFEVEDTGIGVSADQRNRLFQPFSQADPTITRRFGGTGLGLALSQRIAKALHGNLVLDWSAPGQGSRFVFRVPIGPINRTVFLRPSEINLEGIKKVETTVQPDLRLDGMKILLAEDSPDSAQLARRFLESAGAQVLIAKNGEEAIESAKNEEINLILMDMQMPVLDGLEATRRLRQRGDRRPIIALTAHALPDEIERSLRAGCNAHLTKPIRRAVLITEIRRVLEVTS